MFAYQLPAFAERVLAALEGAGHEAWVVGGWVRDAVRGAPPHDVDVATSARWQEARLALEAAGIEAHETGVAHGTVTAVVAGEPVEVTTYRVEGAYSDHRHPDEVRFVRDVREDLARRDFTVNAMAWHPARGLLDPFGGRADLAAGVIRAVGEPGERFAEDALRVLRAVRFACRLGFAVEAGTQRALDAAADDLAAVAPERIGIELDGIVRSGRAGWALLHERRALAGALPELAPLYGFDQRSVYHAHDVAGHTARVCCACEEFTAGMAPEALRWAALLHDVAKPATFSVDERGHGHFFGHPEEGARMAGGMLRRLALPGALVRQVCALVRWHDLPLRPTPRSMRRLLVRLERDCPGQAAPLAFALLDLKRGDAVSKVPAAAGHAVELDAVTHALARELATRAPVCVRDLAVDGSDVMGACGMAPGPGVGLILDALLATVLEGDLPNEREALLAELRRRSWGGAAVCGGQPSPP